jgi:large subunit ribosomal protein L17
MFRNMASSLIRTVRPDEDDPDRPKVAGRIVTTVPKAKELRPYVERLVTMARHALQHQEAAEEFATSAERNSPEWKQWRESDRWQQWNQAVAPALALRRRAFNLLRDDEAVDILFDDLADRFRDRPGGYTRVVRLAARRLGDAGEQALIEFVGEGERDRKRRKREAPVVMKSVEKSTAPAVAAPAATPPQESEADTAAQPSSEGDQNEGEPREGEAKDNQ